MSIYCTVLYCTAVGSHDKYVVSCFNIKGFFVFGSVKKKKKKESILLLKERNNKIKIKGTR